MSNADALPTGWEQTTVVQYLDAPYSAEALAEPVKTWIEVCDVDLSNMPQGNPAWAYGFNVKAPGYVFDQSLHPTQYIDLHQQFLESTRQILGEKSFDHCNVYFDHASRELRPRETHTYSWPHMDGRMPDATCIDAQITSRDDHLGLVFVGMLVNEAGTDVWQGAVTRNDFTGEKGIDLKPGVVESGRLTHEQLPTGKLVIIPPSLIHASHPADGYIAMRHLLRWQVKI